MTRLLFSIALSIVWLCSSGQDRSLPYYLESAKENSPLIKDYRNQSEIHRAEIQKLKAVYKRSTLEVNGECLFVPIVSMDGGRTAFRWNAQDGTDYYGYDLGESSGHLHAGVTWRQPLLGGGLYKTAREQALVDEASADNLARMEEHQLERSVTENYLICLLDRIQTDYADSAISLLKRQMDVVQKLAGSGMARHSDLRLLGIELRANEEARDAAVHSYHTHLMDLNMLCGIDDTEDVSLAELSLGMRMRPASGLSLFQERYRLDSLGAAASLRSFNLRYKPRLDLFVNGGMQTGNLSGWYRHFGWSAGLTFSWTIFDGRQKSWAEHQERLRQNSIRNFRTNAEYQRNMRIGQCLAELSGYEEREKSLRTRLYEYAEVLSRYEKEMKAGQVSVLDYITVLRNKIGTERDYLLARTNRQLVIAAYNYWNW